jgi:hypothetical protein
MPERKWTLSGHLLPLLQFIAKCGSLGPAHDDKIPNLHFVKDSKASQDVE